MSDTITDQRQILSPFDKREVLTLRQAAAIAGKSEATMRVWCDNFGLGRRVGGGNWAVSKVALAMFLDGDAKARRAYHAGDRKTELVAAYFRRFGLYRLDTDQAGDGEEAERRDHGHGKQGAG